MSPKLLAGSPTRLVPPVFAIVVAGWFWLATAAEPEAQFTPEQIEAGKKHPDFATLAKAKTVLLAKIHVTVEGVAESFPPIYELRMVVVPTEGITSNVNVDQLLEVRFARQQEDEPKFDDVPYLVAIGTNEDVDRLLLLKPSTNNLTRVARIAAFHGASQRNRDVILARDNPQMHPLFEELQKAKHLAVVFLSDEPDSVVSFDVQDRLEEHYNVTVAQSLRGDMKAGKLDRLAFTEVASPLGKLEAHLVVVEFRDGRPVVTKTITADEERLRVAAAVAEIDAEKLLDSIGSALKERQRARASAPTRGFFGGSAGSSEPSEGASTPSFDGGIPSGDEFERTAP